VRAETPLTNCYIKYCRSPRLWLCVYQYPLFRSTSPSEKQRTVQSHCAATPGRRICIQPRRIDSDLSRYSAFVWGRFISGTRLDDGKWGPLMKKGKMLKILLVLTFRHFWSVSDFYRTTGVDNYRKQDWKWTG
jgi:hypothetical protein